MKENNYSIYKFFFLNTTPFELNIMNVSQRSIKTIKKTEKTVRTNALQDIRMKGPIIFEKKNGETYYENRHTYTFGSVN